MNNIQRHKADRQVHKKLAAGGYVIVVGGFKITLDHGIIKKEALGNKSLEKAVKQN